MNTLTTAQTIANTANGDANEAMILADKICSADQDWDDESSTWTFDDGSKLYVNSFGDIKAS